MEELQREVSFEFDRKYVYTLEDTLWHAMTHDVHHSAQMSMLLRRLGHAPPGMDYILRA